MGLFSWFRRLRPAKVTVDLNGREFTFSTVSAAISFFVDISHNSRASITKMIRDRSSEICGYKVRYS